MHVEGSIEPYTGFGSVLTFSSAAWALAKEEVIDAVSSLILDPGCLLGLGRFWWALGVGSVGC